MKTRRRHTWAGICFLLAFLLQASAAGAQSFTYTSEEVRAIDFGHIKYLQAPGGELHIWKNDLRGTYLYRYDQELNLLGYHQLSELTRNISFIVFGESYYALVSDLDQMQIFRVQKGVAKALPEAALNALGEVGRYTSFRFLQMDQHLVLEQQLDSGSNSYLKYSSFNQELQPEGSLEYALPFYQGKAQQINPVGFHSRLVIPFRKISDGSEQVLLAILDPINKQAAERLVAESAEDFSTVKTFPGRQTFFLELSRAPNAVSREAARLIRLDSSLEKLQSSPLESRYYDSLRKAGLDHFSRTLVPAMDGGCLLLEMFAKTPAPLFEFSDRQLMRFVELDGNLSLTGTTDFPPATCFLWNDGRKIRLLYEEKLKKSLSLMHTASWDGGIQNDKVLQLYPRHTYFPDRAFYVPATGSVYLPYKRGDDRFGLVRIRP